MSRAEREELLAAQAAPGPRQQKLQQQRPRPRSSTPAHRGQHVPELLSGKSSGSADQAEEGGDVTGRPSAAPPRLPPPDVPTPGNRGGELGEMGRAPPGLQGAPRRLPNGREGEGEGRHRIPLRFWQRRPRTPRGIGAGGRDFRNQPCCHGKAERGTLHHGPRVRVKGEGGLHGHALESGT